MSKKQSGSGPHSSTTSTRDERFGRMWSETHNYVVGPMPVDDFLQRFLRSPTSSVQLEVPSIPTESLEVYVNAAKNDKYGTFIAALQPICSNFEFKDTHKKPMKTFEQFTIKPDVCLVGRDTSGAEVEMSDAEICIELKPENYHDPFDDEGKRTILKDNVSKTEPIFAKETGAGKHVFGQCTIYAAAHQAAQFRTHVFSVLVFHNHARLMRWDRSGVIVTAKLPISSRSFVEFFHLYDHATPSKRGIDISVGPPSPEHISRAFDSFAVDPKFLVQLSLGSDGDSYILPRKPYMNQTHSPLGRSTRTFTAYSTTRECKVFLKDSWRLGSQTPEDVIYKQLHLKNVPHIPTVIEGGDVLDHTTVTQDLLEEKENEQWIRVRPPRGLRSHTHYRLVLKEIATPLSLFPSTKTLVTAIQDALKAHQAAYLAGILHRDISAGNIMIHENGGLLIDWDLSKSTTDNSGREMERTGTWQFISAHLLKNPTAAQGLIDDVESFIHVITWVSFQYAEHKMGPRQLKDFMALIFDHSFHDDDGLTKGGVAKLGYLLSPDQLRQTEFASPNLKELLLDITNTIASRYGKSNPADMLSPAVMEAIQKMIASRYDKSEPDDTLSPAIIEVTRKAHEEEQNNLKLDSAWIISKFETALSKSGWPDADKARTHEIIQVPNAEGQSSAPKRPDADEARTHEIVQVPNAEGQSSAPKRPDADEARTHEIVQVPNAEGQSSAPKRKSSAGHVTGREKKPRTLKSSRLRKS